MEKSLNPDAATQVLEQWMVPDVYAVVSGSPYGEYQLMQYGVQQNRTAQLRAAIQVCS